MKNKIAQCLLLSAGIVFFSSGISFSQTPNDSAFQKKKVEIGIYNFNYLRDYEYFSPIMEGYTLFGTIVHPSVTFNPNNKVSFRTGVFVHENFGDDSLRVRPTFLLTVRNKSNDFSFGNYRNEEGHGLIEPLWFSDNHVIENLEDGFNLKQKFNHFENDTWLDWNKAIQKGSDFQEKIFGGLSAKIFPFKNYNPIFTFPLQAYLLHQGGQINQNDSSFHVTTLMNAAGGMCIKINFDNSSGNSGWYYNSKKKPRDHYPESFISEISVAGYYVFFKEFFPSSYSQFTNGSGIWAQVKLKSKSGAGIEMAYWQGTNFISPKGNPLMQSVSSVFPVSNYTERERQLLFFTLKYENEIAKSVTLMISGEPYYDLNNKLLEFGLHLHLTFTFNEDKHLLSGKI